MWCCEQVSQFSLSLVLLLGPTTMQKRNGKISRKTKQRTHTPKYFIDQQKPISVLSRYYLAVLAMYVAAKR